MVHFASWLAPAAVVLVTWGLVGLLQKIATNHLSAESAFIWLLIGYFALEPLIYPGRSLFAYSARSLAVTFCRGLLNAMGSWALLAAMKNGGKASIVVPLTFLYPLVVILAVPLLLNERITRL